MTDLLNEALDRSMLLKISVICEICEMICLKSVSLSPPAERDPVVVENATDPMVMLFSNLIAVPALKGFET